MPRGPSSSASDLMVIPSPGRRPLEMARPASGSRTDVESTNPIAAPSPRCGTQRPDQPQRPEHHALEGGPPVVLGRVERRSGRRAADGDQRAVDPAQPLQRLGDQPPAASGSARSAAAPKARRLAAELLDRGGDRRRRTGS